MGLADLIINALVAFGTLSLACLTYQSNRSLKESGRSNLVVEPRIMQGYKIKGNPSLVKKDTCAFLMSNYGSNQAEIMG